jgi:MFS family permease
LAVYLLAWVLVGLGMGAGLYDAAFSTLGRMFGAEGRRAITTLTLWGGFASTVCWPLSALMVEAVGWRGACLAYAALQLGLVLPLYLVCLPREARREPERAGSEAGVVPDTGSQASVRGGGPQAAGATGQRRVLAARDRPDHRAARSRGWCRCI